MSESEYLENLEEITSMYLDQHDQQLATAEERLLEATGSKGNEGVELAMTALTMCILSVMGRVTRAAYLSGLAHGASLEGGHDRHIETET